MTNPKHDEKCGECGRELGDATASATAHLFFANLATSARAPGCGDHYRTFVTNLLLRATEAGIYTPYTPEAP